LAGGEGNDVFSATGAWQETIDGGAGDDTIIAQNNPFSDTRTNAYIYLGGAGNDWLSYALLTASTNAVTVDLMAGRSSGIMGNDLLSSIENVLAGAGNDSILGDFLANLLMGGAGNDTLIGGAGNDTLMGGAGDDIILVGTTTLADIYALFAN
jgi:Ca2+-binding RTX toxin-like protein